MKWIFRLLCLLLIFVNMGLAQTEHLSGQIAIPDAEHFNGYLRIGLTRTGIKNICATPAVAVPTMNLTYPIVNGIPQGVDTANFLSQDCMSPRYPYYIEIADTNNIVQSTDNWYLPRTITGLAEIGAMQEQHFGGPITVAIPYGIIANPSQMQTVTQAPGTSFNFVTALGGKLLYNGVEVSTGTSIPDPLRLTQILLNGAEGPNNLEVLGTIDVFGGYRINGNGGIPGQCLVSDGNVFQAGACSPAFPTLHYQLASINGAFINPTPVLDFSSNFFFTTTSTTNGPATHVELTGIGTPGTYTNITGITTDNWGRVVGVSTGGSTVGARVCNSNGCYIKQADGTIEQWGVSTAFGQGADQAVVLITFPTPFTTTANLSFQAWPDNCSQSPCSGVKNPIAMNGQGATTTSNIIVQALGVVPTGGGGTSILTTLHAMWRAIGN